MNSDVIRLDPDCWIARRAQQVGVDVLDRYRVRLRGDIRGVLIEAIADAIHDTYLCGRREGTPA